MVVRIEDTDQKRSSEEAVGGILEDLAWLGIDWDEGPERDAVGSQRLGGDPREVGPFFQAQRLDLYATHLDKLLQAGLAWSTLM